MGDSFLTTCRFDGGKLAVRNLKLMADTVAEWKDGEGTVKIERLGSRRSSAQNAYLWAVVNFQTWTRINSSGRTLRGDGWTIEDVHDYLKAKYLPKHLCVISGNGEVLEDLVIGGSTAGLSKSDFAEYVGNVQRGVADTLGISIDDADPDWREKLDAA